MKNWKKFNEQINGIDHDNLICGELYRLYYNNHNNNLIEQEFFIYIGNLTMKRLIYFIDGHNSDFSTTEFTKYDIIVKEQITLIDYIIKYNQYYIVDDFGYDISTYDTNKVKNIHTKLLNNPDIQKNRKIKEFNI